MNDSSGIGQKAVLPFCPMVQILTREGFLRNSSQVHSPLNPTMNKDMWVWLKIQQEGLRRFWSIFPLTRIPFWYQFFEPYPCFITLGAKKIWQAMRSMGAKGPFPFFHRVHK